MKILLVILDGLGDRACKELFGETPLEAASTPFMNFLAREGVCGVLSPIEKGLVPESSPAHFEILGYSPFQKFYPGRGPLEALGIGYKLKEGDVAFRVNFATVKDGIVVDRRAGRIESVKEFEDLLTTEIDGVEFILKAGVEHRAALIIRGPGLSEKVSDSDPHKTGASPKKVLPLSPEAQKTAGVLNKYIDFAAETLKNHKINRERERKGLPPANFILLRGAGKFREVESFKERFKLKACCIAGGGLYKGIARFFGIDVIEVEGATGKKKSDFEAKFKAAKDALKSYEFVWVHIKAPDLFGHDGDAVGKKSVLEEIDKAMRTLYEVDNIVICVTGDHSTPCSLKNHSGDDVPLLFFAETVRKDLTPAFGERFCMVLGGLGRIKGKDVMNELLNLSGKAEIIE